MRWFAWIAATLLVLSGGWWAGQRGLETCGWLDRALGLSGCAGVRAFDGISPSRGNLDVPFDDQDRAILVAGMRTVDGWRGGLILFDPVTGAEGGRYPVPLRHDSLRLLASPEGDRLLLMCGIVAGGCGESGNDAVMVDRATLRGFESYETPDRYLRAFPGTPLPDEAFGHSAVFAAGGERIVSDPRNQPLVLLDTEGQEIAVLDERGMLFSEIVVSPDGARIARWEPESAPSGGDMLRIWNAMDGKELHRIEGNAGWRLRARPFWSPDGTAIFTPRSSGGTMLIDHFPMP